MLFAGNELVLLCFVVIIQHVSGSSYWRSRGCCWPNNDCCCSYGSCGSSNYEGWNGYGHQNCNKHSQWLANGGGECDSSCTTELSGPTSGSGYGRRANQWSGAGYDGWNHFGSSTSSNAGLDSSVRNGGWISTGQSNDYSGSQSSGADYNTRNTPNRFAGYPRWNVQGYGTTSHDGLNSLTNSGGLDRQRTQSYVTNLGQGNNYIRRQSNYADYNDWYAPNRFADYARWNSQGHGTTSHDGLNGLTNSGGFFGQRPLSYGKNLGQSNDYIGSQSNYADYNHWFAPNRFADYARWNSQGDETTSYDGLNSLINSGDFFGQRTLSYGKNLGQSNTFIGSQTNGADYNNWYAPNRFADYARWDSPRYGITSYDGLNSLTYSVGYDGSNGIVGYGHRSRTGGGWDSLSTRIIPSDVVTNTDWSSLSDTANYDGSNSLASRTVRWNDPRRGAGYGGLNSYGTVAGYDGSNILINDAGCGGLAVQESRTRPGWNLITTDADTDSSAAGHDGWNNMRIGAGYDAWNNLNSATNLDGINSSDYISSGVALNDGWDSMTRGNSLEEGLDGQGAWIVFDGENSDVTDEDCGRSIYENLSYYPY